MSRRNYSNLSASPATRSVNSIPRATHPFPGAEGEDRTPARAAEVKLLYYGGNTLRHGSSAWRNAVFHRCSRVRRRGGRFHSGNTEQDVYIATIVAHKFGVCKDSRPHRAGEESSFAYA